MKKPTALTRMQLKDLRWKLRRQIEEAQELLAAVEAVLAAPVTVTPKH